MASAVERERERRALQALLLKYGDGSRNTWHDACAMIRASHGLHTIAERQCSEEMSDAETARVEKREKLLESSITRIVTAYGGRVTFAGDPRGYVVKLHFEPKKGTPYDGRKPANTWGGEEEGYGI